MPLFLPEGYAPQKNRTWEYDALQAAAACGEILQAPVLFCDTAHDLHIDLFPYEGLIPRAEISLAGRNGFVSAGTEPIGRPVMFRVIGRLPDGRWLLSRAEAQREAQTLLLGQITPGDVLPVTVMSVHPHAVFCDIGCGLSAYLGLENLSVSRVYRASERVRVGQKLFAAASAIDRQSGKVILTHKELLGTWRENAERFLPGQTVCGIVRGIKPYGVFVELSPNLCGLAEPVGGLQPGDAVSVFVKSVLPQRRKVKLTILDRLQAVPVPAKLHYFITSGNVSAWEYFTS